jgi:hypothetical protein
MRKPLTPQLSYLDPVFDELSRLSRGVDESYDTSLLLALLGARLYGLSHVQARKALAADCTALNAWLVDQPKHRGWFVSAFMESPDLVDLIREEMAPEGSRKSPFGAALPKVKVPSGYKLRTERGNVTVHKRSAAIVVIPLPVDEVEEFKQIMAREGATITPFAIGDVSGSTYSMMDVTSFVFQSSRSGFLVSVSGAVKPSELKLVLQSLLESGSA